MPDKVTLLWFRRDLRLEDNVGLYHALKNNTPVLPIFIFDIEILEQLPKNDARLSFIYQQLQLIREELQSKAKSSIAIYHGNPIAIFNKLSTTYTIETVFTNHDYEPYALVRDKEVSIFLNEKGIGFKTFKDQVVFEKNEIVKGDGNPYVVYTPYKNKWKEKFNPAIHLVDYQPNTANFIKNTKLPNLTLKDIGFKKAIIQVADYTVTRDLIKNYKDTRDFPAIEKSLSLIHI